MPSRRRTLAALVGLFGLAGCTGDEPVTKPSSTPPTESPPVSSTPTATETGTGVPTDTCAEQSVFPDIEVENERSTEARVSVTVVELPAGSVDDPGASPSTPTQSATPRPSAQTLFEAEYVVDAGELVREDEHVYRGADPDDHDYRLDCGHDGSTASLPIPAVVENPTLYGVHAAIREGGPELWTVHGDPGPRYNPNCY